MKEEISKQVKIKALSITDVISSALPCPFCGEKPNVDKSYLPSEVEIKIFNSVKDRSSECKEQLQFSLSGGK